MAAKVAPTSSRDYLGCGCVLCVQLDLYHALLRLVVCVWVHLELGRWYRIVGSLFAHTNFVSCNIHNPEDPHCPWCITTAFLSNVPMWVTPFLMLLATGGLVYRFPEQRLFVYAFVPLGVWAGFNLAYAAIFKAAYHYPYFIHNHTKTE